MHLHFGAAWGGVAGDDDGIAVQRRVVRFPAARLVPESPSQNTRMAWQEIATTWGSAHCQTAAREGAAPRLELVRSVQCADGWYSVQGSELGTISLMKLQSERPTPVEAVAVQLQQSLQSKQGRVEKERGRTERERGRTERGGRRTERGRGRMERERKDGSLRGKDGRPN